MFIKKIYTFWSSIRVGTFLALSAIKRSNKWMTSLIIFIMVITFLNLVLVSGVMSGLIEGSIKTFREKSLGDVIISPLDNKKYVLNSDDIINILKNDTRIKGYSYRYQANGTIEANWQTLSSNDIANKRSLVFAGINPDRENETTALSSNVKEGEFLTKEDASKYVLLGKDIVQKYSVVSDVDPTLLRNTEPGAKVRIKIGSSTNEYIVKGIIVIKNQEVGAKVFMVDSELRKLANLLPQNISNIAIRLNPGIEPKEIKAIFYANGFQDYAKIQTFEEATPAFVIQMKDLFGLLGTMFGSIGIFVAAITLFIVIFINAITRRKQIGILKGIGISSFAIEFSYVFQAVLYSLVGCAIGSFFAFVIVKPYFDANPIDFPFSDGILVIDFYTTVIRITYLTIISMIAGYVPARMIVKRNTLDAILGR